MIGRGQLETQHPEDRRQEASVCRRGRWKMSRSVSAVSMARSEYCRCPPRVPTPTASQVAIGIRGQPHGDIASLDQRAVVCRPISDVVFCLVLRVHARLHIEIMHLLSPRWPGGRSWLTEGAGSVHQRQDTTVGTWMGWSAKHKWVSRSLARDEWIARTSDDQIVSNVTACKLALTTRAFDYLTANDGADFLRAARALSLHFPPMQRMADVSERIEDLSDIPDADIARMKAIRDAARAKNEHDRAVFDLPPRPKDVQTVDEVDQ